MIKRLGVRGWVVSLVVNLCTPYTLATSSSLALQLVPLSFQGGGVGECVRVHRYIMSKTVRLSWTGHANPEPQTLNPNPKTL